MKFEKKTKKTWETPKITILDTDNVRGGGHPLFHEKTMTGFNDVYGSKFGHVNNGPLASQNVAYNVANILS